MTDSNPFQWLQDNLATTSAIANAGAHLRADRGERYGSASMHLAMNAYNQLNEPGEVEKLGELVSAISGQPGVAAARMKLLLQQVPVLREAPVYSAPNAISDLPQILATAYFGRVACANFSAEEGSNYQTFLHRMQWLQLKVRETWNRDDMANIDAVISAGATKGFTLEPRILQRLQHAGGDLMPTPSSVVAAVGVGMPQPPSNRAYPLGDERFLNYVKGIDTALWKSGRLVVPPSTSTTNTRYLTHMRTFLTDTADRLALGVLPCDRVPIVSPWYATTVLAVRQYAAAVSRAVSENADRPIESPVDLTLFSLMSMAAQKGDDMPCPTDTLFSAKSKSMYTKSEAQDGPWWVLLRATLSGISPQDAAEVSRRLMLVPDNLAETVQTAALMCVMMHTQTGQAIIGYKIPKAEGIDAFPVAKRLLKVRDPVCGQNALDMVMATYSGTADLTRLASNDLAFTDVARQGEAWSQELEARVDAADLEALPSREVPVQVSHDEISARFCAALRAVGMQWLANEDAAATNGDEAPAPGDLSQAEAWRTLERIGTAQASQHCKEWMCVAFDFARALEERMQKQAQPPLIASPIDYKSANAIGSRISARDDEAYMRMHFRMQAEHALHNARRGGMWGKGHQLILAAWVSCAAPSTAALDRKEHGLRLFARVISETTMDEGAGLLPTGWREAVERRGDDSVIECALQFERALHARNAQTDAMQEAMPMLPRSSAMRVHVCGIASGPARFDAAIVPTLDTQSATALSRLRKHTAVASQQNEVLVSTTPFTHGCAVAVVGVPPPSDEVAVEMPRLVEQKWNGRNALLERLAAFRSAGKQ